MSDPAYPAARIVAKKVQAHFSRRLALARERGRDALAPEPDAEAIETLIDAAFWASLRREEGLTPKMSVAPLPPGQAGQPLRFEPPPPPGPAPPPKRAPAVERPGMPPGVWAGTAADQVPGNPGPVRVWGT